MTDTTNPQQADRRERYAQALGDADIYALIERRDDRYRFADAAMTVADAEQADLRTHVEQVEDLLRLAHETSNRSEAERARAHDRSLTLQAELASIRDLLRTENARANAAIDRETTGEEAEEEQRLALSQALGLGTGAPWETIRDRAAELAALPAPVDRAAIERVRSVLEFEAVVGRSALDYRGLIATALMADAASGPGGVAGETQQDEGTTADKAAALGLTDIEYRAQSHAAAVATIRAAIPGMYAHVGFRLEDVLNEGGETQQDETCGRTWSTSGDEYPPCTRPVDHREAYCRSADGQSHFIGAADEQPAAVSQPDGKAATSCSARPCNEAADELCDNHARIKYHAEDEHAFCDPDCTEDPS
jgi:hypothetical protein